MSDRPRWQSPLIIAAGLLLAGAGGGTFLGFLGEWGWPFDLFAHFRPHYVALLLLSAAGFFLARRKLWGIAVSLILVLNLLFILPLYGGMRDAVAGAPRLKIISFNLNVANTEMPEVVAYLARSDADVIVVLECTPQLAAILTKGLPRYQMVGSPRNDLFGILVMSKLAIDSHKIHRFAGNDTPAIEVNLVFGQVKVPMLAIHTWPPMGKTQSRRRNIELEAVADWALAHPDNAIVIGDFNATPWSHAFRSLLYESQLVNSQRGFGLQATWPDLLGRFGIPIDHCLHARSLTTLERSVGPSLGSDHRPIELTLSLAKK